MDNLDDLNCPQFVSFHKIMSGNDSFTDLESSPCSSLKHDNSLEMDTEDSVAYENQSAFEDIQSNTYLDTGTLQTNYELSPASSEYHEEGFTVHCRENTAQSNSLQEKIDKAAKFHSRYLSDVKKRKREDEHVPMAEQVATYLKKTPERFHSTGPKVFQPGKHWSPTVVHPKSPNLRAAKRARGINVMSREEQEAKELEDIKNYKFRARPLNKKILEKRQSLKFGKKTPTKPRAQHLRTADRAVEQNKKREDEKPYEFHAQPVPKAILSGPTGLKEKPTIPVTQARTPNFALKSRLEKRRNEAKMNETQCSEVQTFKAFPAPVNNAPFTIKHEKKLTKIKPFSFDDKDKERMMKKEQKIMEEIEKENAVYLFKAQPVPSPTPSALPPVSKKLPTQPEPFNFHLEHKKLKYSLNMSSEQTSSFKAQPATVLTKAPFVPDKAPKPTTEVKEFQLHTDVRAAERQKLKEINDIKEHEKELQLRQMKELEEERERQEIMKLRKETVHKANPIRIFKPFEIKPSEKLPTEPISPKFKTDERLSLRH